MAKIFGDAKPWQLVVIALGVLGGIGGVTWMVTHDQPVELSHEITLVDVSTGDIYTVSTKKRAVVIPEISPTSGKQTLVRVKKNSQGKWVAVEQDLDALAEGTDRSVVHENFEVAAKGEPKSLTIK